MPSTTQMGKKEAWAHYSRGILKLGRITHLEPTQPDPENEVDVEILKKM
jgi:hypothetical protein